MQDNQFNLLNLETVEIFKLIRFLFKAIFFKKKEYTLRFVKQNSRWYADIKGWPCKYHDNLEMVFGSNRLLDTLDTNNTGNVYTTIYPNSLENGNLFLTKQNSTLLGGAFYKATILHDNVVTNFPEEIWICPVTLFVLGKYPKNMVVKTISMKINN